MTTYAYASGSAPNWVFSPTASSTFTLLQYAQAIPSTPVFQYFGYGSGGALSTTAYSASPNLGSNAAEHGRGRGQASSRIRPTTGLR